MTTIAAAGQASAASSTSSGVPVPITDATSASTRNTCGATAAQSLFGPAFRLTQNRGRVFASPWAERSLATWHPSAVLRADDPAHADELVEQLTADLSLAARHVAAAAKED